MEYVKQSKILEAEKELEFKKKLLSEYVKEKDFLGKAMSNATGDKLVQVTKDLETIETKIKDLTHNIEKKTEYLKFFPESMSLLCG
ncbi:uncharacterized protein IL334_006748 [Kwoniella shivajii]|uniref:Uncharacterized protein n=1 Tax=Kwoniella shivajii TaxID=564305 RepID=A0ABZ1D6U2_9TREE|nr:hypothetical protein IL334_006748 [Kwoniella shivajii]